MRTIYKLRIDIFAIYSIILSFFYQLDGGTITQINSYETWKATPRIIPSTDPAGIAWNSQNGIFYIADSEINEEEQWNLENIFATNSTGSILYDTYLTRPEASSSSSREPCGICYYPAEDAYYVVNDDRAKLYKYQIVSGEYVLLNEWLLEDDPQDPAYQPGLSPGYMIDPEGITINPETGHLYIADGASGDNKIVAVEIVGTSLQYIPSESFSVAQEQTEAEGIAYRPSSGTLFIVSEDEGGKIYEWEIDTGTLLDIYDLSTFTPAPIAPQGLAFGPRSTNNLYESLYIADGGYDNTSDPDPDLYNDGVIYEAKIGIEDVSLPVELASFKAIWNNYYVLIEWITESEVENVGYELLRSDTQTAEYETITSYIDNDDMLGQGNTSIRQKYSYADELVEPGKTYRYLLSDIDIYGMKTMHGPVSVTVDMEYDAPIGFKLYQNYPNPFNPITKIKFDIHTSIIKSIETKIIIYNNLGQKVKTLFQSRLSPGTYEVQWDALTDQGHLAPAGVYFAHLVAGTYSNSIKMILLK